jgi:hypothetical protein
MKKKIVKVHDKCFENPTPPTAVHFATRARRSGAVSRSRPSLLFLMRAAAFQMRVSNPPRESTFIL